MSSTYIVFAVDSADRLTLLAPHKAGQAPEFKSVLLNYVTSPKMARRNAEGEWNPDEYCAFDAMDFVRSACIGKQVQWKDSFVVEPLQRVSGDLTLPDGTDCAQSLLKKGLATISDRLPQKMDRALHEKYLHLQDQARAARVGVWAKDAKQKVRHLKPFPPPDREIIDRNIKGKTLKVRVERVQSGSTITVMLLDFHQQLIVMFSGAASPSINKKDGSGVDPVGMQAKFHTERSLLHRHVPMHFDGLDKFGNFLVTLGGAKTFQQELISLGFASYNEVTAQFTPEHREKLRAADAEAREKKLGVYEFGDATSDPTKVVATSAAPVTAAEKAAAPAGPRRDYPGVRNFDGHITQIVAGDTVVVRTEGGEYVRMALAGIKCAKPKRTEHEKDGKGGEPRTIYEDFAWEAREYLRTKYIGAAVSVNVEFGRHYEDNKEIRPVATVRTIESGVDLGAALVSQGFATVQIGHSDTVSTAGDLFTAEAEAKEAGKGLHGGAPCQSVSVHELNRLGASKGKYYLSFLHRGMQGNRPPVWKATCDMVMSGSSFRVYIPKEHFQLTIKLGGVITPSTGGLNNEPADPFAQEAKDFAITHLQQRECEVQVETCDKGGNFIGAVFIGGKNFAVMIAEAGLATVAAADRLPYVNELQRAQKAAQDAHKYIWSSKGAIPARQAKRNQQALLANPDAFIPATEGVDAINVSITEVSSGSSVWIQPQDDESGATYEAILGALSGLASTAPHPEPKRNEIVSAYYKSDKSWLRGKIISIDKVDKTAEVLYIDFGTIATVAFKNLRQIPKSDEELEIVRTAAPLAFEVQIAFVKRLGDNNEWNDAACDYAWEFAEFGDLTARAVYTDGAKRKYYAIKSVSDDLATFLIGSGVALTERTAAKVDGAAVQACLTAQESARKKHKQMWQYGDIEDDDEE